MKYLGYFLVIAGLAIGLGLLFALPVMLLWNYCLVDAVDGVKEITWLQAWGLNVLTHLLFTKASVKSD
jgi:hypothetical protein